MGKTENQHDDVLNVAPKESDKWFDEMISGLQMDRFFYDENLMNSPKKEIFDAMINNDQNFMHSYARNQSRTYFISKLLNTYFHELGNNLSLPNLIALELSDSKILAWIEIKDDDLEAESAFILAEAKANHLFSEYGFYISSTIVEESDHLEVPTHYKKVKVERKKK